MRSTVPEDMWPADRRQAGRGEQHPEVLDVGMDSFDYADDDAYDPTEFIDEDDEL